METQGSASGNGITVTFEKTADWDAGSGNRGFTGNVTILNQTGSAITRWDLKFDFLATISQMWNASYTQAGNTFTIIPADWNARLENGQSRNFGFNGVYSGAFQEPTSYVLSGIPVGEQTPPVPPAPVCNLDTTFTVTADWQNGDGSKGFVAEMYLTNVGSDPVNWQLGFDFAAQITNMWNASYTQEGNRYTITPSSWNVRIEPGQTRSFGFQGAYSGTLGEPQNVVCNGGSTDEDELTPGQQRFVDALVTLSAADIEAISQELFDAMIADSNITPEAWNQLAYDLTLQYAGPPEAGDGISPQSVPGYWASFCDRDGIELNLQECEVAYNQLFQGKWAFFLGMYGLDGFITTLSEAVYRPAREGRNVPIDQRQ